MRRVMIATPAHDGRSECAHSNGVVEAVKLCARDDMDIIPIWWPGEALVQHARNMLVAIALEANMNDLVFIDEDQGFTGAQVQRLLSHPVDCVGAAVRLKCEEERYNVRAPQGDPHALVSDGELWEVASVGTGFLRLSRKALEAVWERSLPYQKNGQKTRMVFEVGVSQGHLIGEDVALCLKLADAGIQVYVDPSFVPGHIGPKTYRGDFKAYVARLLNESTEPALANER